MTKPIEVVPKKSWPEFLRDAGATFCVGFACGMAVAFSGLARLIELLAAFAK